VWCVVVADDTKRKPGRPKGIPASAKQKAAASENRKQANKARAKKKAARDLAKLEDPKPRWKKLEDGDISVSELTDEELVRGEVMNNDGGWEGKRHRFSPRILGRMNTEYKRRIRKGIDRLGMVAVEAIEEILDDDEARAQQFAAARMVIEYNIGKVPDVVHVGAETEYDRLQQTAFVILRGDEHVDPGELEGDDDEPTGDIVDAEWKEVEA
jgi:hypothetical protein